MKLLCWNCGESLDDIPRPISRHSACSACFNELHCCRLCRHYDEKRSMQCFEDRADPPLQKENANFCDFFSPSANAYTVQTTAKSTQARDELSALFADPEASGEQVTHEDSDENPDNPEQATPSKPLSAEAEARKKLDDLFN